MRIASIYTCDFNHNHDSKNLIAISVEKPPITIIEEHCKKEGNSLSEDDYQNLSTILQTQSHKGDHEYIIEIHESDILI